MRRRLYRKIVLRCTKNAVLLSCQPVQWTVSVESESQCQYFRVNCVVSDLQSSMTCYGINAQRASVLRPTRAALSAHISRTDYLAVAEESESVC